MAAINWSLSSCCDTAAVVFICFYAGYALVTLLLGKVGILKPMRLLGVFVHEFGHASSCWITGGSVKKIEVYNNEGGVTGYTGGVRCLVIPAGYVGSAFWGGLFVALSGNRIGATIVASLITAALLVSLCYKPNGIVVAVSIGFSVLNIAAILIEYLVFSPFLEYVTLWYGVFIGYFAVIDIYDDLITRTADGSDAVACSKLIPCCHPRCVGVQFWLAAVGFNVLGLYFALVWQVSFE
jgi:Peptidase M50B-like